MSALQKLAVAKEVGTSRPATAEASSSTRQTSSRESRCQPQLQQAQLLHPLLQSLHFPQPKCLSTTASVQQSSQHNTNNSSRTTSGSQQGSSTLCASTGSTIAATALATALKQSSRMQLSSGSTQQLLETIAAMQQHQQQRVQLQSPPKPAVSVSRKSCATVISASLDGAIHTSSNGSCNSSLQHTQQKPGAAVTLQQALAAAAAAAAAAPAPAVVCRPVTPLVTKPHKTGSIHIQQGWVKGCVTSATTAAAIKSSAQGNFKVLDDARPVTATIKRNLVTPVQADNSSSIAKPSSKAAVIPRPGTAAAFRLLRSISANQKRLSSQNRPHSAAGGYLNSDKPGMRQDRQHSLQQKQQQHQHDPTWLRKQKQQQPHVQQDCPALQREQLQPAEQVLEQQGHQVQQQQQQLPENEPYWCVTRPGTAAMRAMLASSHRKDGIAERIEYYRKLNSANDNMEGLDIVHEAESEGVDETGELPDWLRDTTASPAACQAAPMVLNLEDLIQSTAEVLEAEIEQQLDDMDLKTLQVLKATLMGPELLHELQ